MIYLDASALVSFLVNDVHSPAIRDFVRRESPVLGVGDFAAAEFAAAVAARVRRGLDSDEEGTRVLGVFDAWAAGNAEALALEADDPRLAATFVRRFDLALRAPDALHIAVCHRLGVPLLTFDARQADAARSLGVTALVPGAAA